MTEKKLAIPFLEKDLAVWLNRKATSCCWFSLNFYLFFDVGTKSDALLGAGPESGLDGASCPGRGPSQNSRYCLPLTIPFSCHDPSLMRRSRCVYLF